jgi:hypothetical protein
MAERSVGGNLFFEQNVFTPVGIEFAAMPRTETGLPRNRHGGIAADTPAT